MARAMPPSELEVLIAPFAVGLADDTEPQLTCGVRVVPATLVATRR